MMSNAQLEEVYIHLTDGLQSLVYQVHSMKNDMVQIKKDLKFIREAVSVKN